MLKFFRIQPSGLDASHLSEDSSGEAASLHVFDSVRATIFCSELPTVYGDEVVEIEAPRCWDNGDVEGVAIDPTKAKIVARYTLRDFAILACPAVGDMTAAEMDEIEDSLAWSTAQEWAVARKKI